MPQLTWSLQKITDIVNNADNEQLILLIKEAAEPNIDVFDNESDTLEENEPLINNNPENGRFSLLNGSTVVEQNDNVRNLLSITNWSKLFDNLINNVKDQGLIETLDSFSN